MSRGGRTLRTDNLNENVKECRYDVRGEIYLAAVERIKQGKEVIFTNVGNPHALGQQPITFGRQVLALLIAPFLMDHPSANSLFPSDVIARAKVYLKHIKGGLGAYTDSKGNPYIRQEIADFITRQSGQHACPDNIFISNGASEVARMLLQAMIRGSNDGIMVPIPQYPLYSASIALYGGQLVPYYLDEENGWALDIGELKRSLETARSKGICVRAMVFINPGNPTGQCLSEQNLKDLIAFCYESQLVLMADEVYQENSKLFSNLFLCPLQLLACLPASLTSTPLPNLNPTIALTQSTTRVCPSFRRARCWARCPSPFALVWSSSRFTPCPRARGASAACAAATWSSTTLIRPSWTSCIRFLPSTFAPTCPARLP
jgi:glutamate--glyoxylate aminotransferase